MSSVDKGDGLEQLLGGRTYLENPRWHEGLLWVSDHYTGEVLGVSPSGQIEETVEVPDRPSGLGWLDDGRLLVVMMNTRQLVAQEQSGDLSVYANLSDEVSNQLNDMVVDPETDDVYVGPMGFDFFTESPDVSTTTSLVHVDGEGTVTRVGADLSFPNGLAISPDGDTLVVAETFGGQLTAFDLPESGPPTNQRVWADFGETPETSDVDEFAEAAIEAGLVLPDGICFDAEGAVWVADPFNQRAVRTTEGGEITDTVDHDGFVRAAMLGGADGRTLYLTADTAVEGVPAMNARGSELLAMEVAVGHGGLP
jgi:sugar lactone lactonase YvrE